MAVAVSGVCTQSACFYRWDKLLPFDVQVAVQLVQQVMHLIKSVDLLSLTALLMAVAVSGVRTQSACFYRWDKLLPFDVQVAVQRVMHLDPVSCPAFLRYTIGGDSGGRGVHAASQHK